MRNPENIVLEAELLSSAPERVQAWLEETAKEKRLRDEGIERSLLERRDPLVVLSLARLASNSDILRAIFAGPGADSKAVRLGVLMNAVVRDGFGDGIPNALVPRRTDQLDQDPSDVAAFVAGLDAEEVTALFLNPTLDREFLTTFLEQKGPWQVLDEARRLVAVGALSINPRMQNDEEDFSAAWGLAGKLPVRFEWAKQLSRLYEMLRPSYLNEEYGEYLHRHAQAVLEGGPHASLAPYIEKVLELASRWVPDPADLERVDSERRELAGGYLGVFARTRKGIARLAVEAASSDDARRALLTHDDPAVRSACYAAADLTLEEMKAAEERDPLLIFEQIVHNPCAWHTRAQREFLREMAHDRKRDPEYTDYPRSEFERYEREHRERHPEWFKDERVATSGAAPLTSGIFGAAIDGVIGELRVATELAKESHDAILKLIKRTVWLGWGIAIVLALVLIRSFVGHA